MITIRKSFQKRWIVILFCVLVIVGVGIVFKTGGAGGISSKTSIAGLIAEKGRPLAFIRRYEVGGNKQLKIYGAAEWTVIPAVRDYCLIYSDSERFQDALTAYYREKRRDDWPGVTFGASGLFESNSVAVYSIRDNRVIKVDKIKFGILAVYE